MIRVILLCEKICITIVKIVEWICLIIFRKLDTLHKCNYSFFLYVNNILHLY